MQEYNAEVTLVEKIEEIEVLINEIKQDQKEIQKIMEHHHKETMKKLSKLREYQKIDDMNNQMMEQRMITIEYAVQGKKK